MPPTGETNPLVTFDQAQSFFRQGDFRAAMVIIDALVEEYPEQKNLLFARARCLAALRRTKEARIICYELVKKYDSPRAQNLLEQIGYDDSDEPATPATLDDILRAPLDFSDSSTSLISKMDEAGSSWGDIASRIILYFAAAASAGIVIRFLMG